MAAIAAELAFLPWREDFDLVRDGDRCLVTDGKFMWVAVREQATPNGWTALPPDGLLVECGDCGAVVAYIFGVSVATWKLR